MTLSIQRSDRRDRRLCRFGVMLVVCSLVINMVAVPKAKAVVIDATAAFGAAAATAAINGTTATTLFTGMGTSAATGSVIGLMDTYAAATGVAASGTALASTIATGILVAGGTLLVGAAAAALIGGFIDWMREQEGLEAGGNEVVLFEETCVFLNTGEAVSFVVGSAVNNVPFTGTIFRDNIHYVLQDGTEFYATPDQFFFKFSGDTSFSSGSFSYVSGDSFGFFLDGTTVIPKRLTAGVTSKGSYGWTSLWRLNPIDTSLSLQPNPEFQEIPQEIPEGQVLSIDTGLTTLPQDDPQVAADAIMQSAIDGALAPTVSVEADPSVQPDPEPEPDPDPELPPDAPDLPSNLGDLGHALTTRFPFSIPWDIAKAVKLLAAPAKPPYWEIDFMEPIRYRFSDLGDTTITIDLGKPEYEIIGITTRLTSTIGFCLALAAATKRFIWTA